LGRVDRQVKISGKRVELDAIEACLRRSGLTTDAAVTSALGADGVRKIHAYITTDAPVTTAAGSGAVVGAVRAFLKSELPDYMWPSSISVLDALPLSPTGKVDRSRLPPPAAAVATAVNFASGAAPATARQAEIEALLLSVWREVLGSQSVGVNDNLFDVGGTSLNLIQVHAKISETLNDSVTVIDMFQHPRIRALARWMAERPTATAPAARAAAAAASAGSIPSASERARRQTEALARARPAVGRHSR
jgi:hypothetical protein